MLLPKIFVLVLDESGGYQARTDLVSFICHPDLVFFLPLSGLEIYVTGHLRPVKHRLAP